MLASAWYNLCPLLPQPVQALRIAFELEAAAEGDGMTIGLRRLYDISRSTDPAVQSSLPCGQACLWIGLCWACMNDVPQVIGTIAFGLDTSSCTVTSCPLNIGLLLVSTHKFALISYA